MNKQKTEQTEKPNNTVTKFYHINSYNKYKLSRFINLKKTF